MRRARRFVALALGAALAVGLRSRVASAATLEAGAELGFAQRSLYRVPIESVGIRALLGGRGAHMAGGFRFALDVGSTLEGLRVVQGHGGFLVDYVIGRARFGFAGGLGFLSIPRVTSGGSLGGIFLEGTLRISADLAYVGAPRPITLPQEDEEEPPRTRPAIYVAAEVAANTALVWGPSLFLGVRY